MLTTTLLTLLSAGASIAAPLRFRALDAAAVAEAQVRDDTATRALSAVPIKTSDGKCLSVTSGTGDFRDNLVPVLLADCDGSAGQQFDIITAGKHNDQPGNALIVSSLIQGCLNFDPRRAAGNQVLLFSCGGRADGGGLVTNSQLFAFQNGASAPLPLAPINQAGTCLFNNAGKLDSQACTVASPSATQLFTIGAGGGAAAPAPPVTTAVATTVATTVAATAAPAATTAASAPPTSAPLTKLDAAAVAEAQVRDDTATRALSGAPIKTSDGKCLSVTSGTGDFRDNLVPVLLADCDGSAGQQFDIITAGKHNDQPGNALIVSSLIQGCLNFDPRRAAGNQVLLFSCGGRADGGGLVTNSQLFAFQNGASAPLPLAPINQAGTCLFNNAGKLDSQACTVASPSATQLFTIGAGGGAAAPPPPATTAVATTAAPVTTVATTAAPATTTTASAPPTSAPLTKLDAAAVAEAQVRDDTATRALSGAPIKTSDGKCLSVTSGTGDFRDNLVPVLLADCDGSAGQQFDIITAGKHNDQPGNALIVSSLIQGCLNFDPRRAAGNQVLLFSCGGRADGGGLVTNSQLFSFKNGASAPLPLAPINQAGTCLFNNAGKLDSQACTVASPSTTQLFTIG
ncbi:hypothetical protein DFH09DRAFT_114974 [Mycena vulgaris]|nr:hypothetical protein DFH09DRAFT_114974 [Mycena vulgaris]